MMGSGKTAVGGALARALDVAFLDSDTEIVRAANMTIAEIFQRDGEAFFRDKEMQVIERLLIGESGVLSTGGGAFMRPEVRELVAQKGVAVWLRADLELLWSRVRHKNTRPLLQTNDPKRTLREIAETRDPVYALADLAVDADAKFSIEMMAGRVLDALLSRPDVVETTE